MHAKINQEFYEAVSEHIDNEVAIMNPDQHEPVLIVGSGPSGMVLANELLRRRVPCRMIDKRSGPTETSRSFTLHAKTMEMFEHMGVAHRFLQRRIEKPRLSFSTSKARIPIQRWISPVWTVSIQYILIYNQNDTEQRLREHLDATYAFHPEWGVELTAFTETEDSFSANLQNGYR